MNKKEIETLNQDNITELYDDILEGNSFITGDYRSYTLTYYIRCVDGREGYYTYGQNGCNRGFYCPASIQCGTRRGFYSPTATPGDACIVTTLCGNQGGYVCCPPR